MARVEWCTAGQIVCDDAGEPLAITNRAISGPVRWEPSDFQWLGIDISRPDDRHRLTRALRVLQAAAARGSHMSMNWVV